MQFLAISGSLRARSSNAELLLALAALGAPVALYGGLGSLPHFNPDLDAEGMAPPAPVHDLRVQIDRADGVWISSPEYAHGVPGALKNALDWLVSSPAMLHKPVALLNASPRATLAQASLAETLRTMSVELVEAACIALPLHGTQLDAAAIAADARFAVPLRAAVAAMSAAAPAYRARRAELGIDALR
jgi:chromate reductase, NAD(P)H dehydrogenase (quinone)